MLYELLVPDEKMNLIKTHDCVPDIEDIEDRDLTEDAFVSIFFNNNDANTKMFNLSKAYCRGNFVLRSLIKQWLIDNKIRLLNHYCRICDIIPISSDHLLNEDSNFFAINSHDDLVLENSQAESYLYRFPFFQN